MVSALPTMVYYGDAPPRHLRPGEHGVERAHLTGARGKGLGVVREQDRLSNPVEDVNWDYAMRIVWGASPRSVCEPVLLAIEEYLHRRSRLESLRTPFERLEVAGAGPAPINTAPPADEHSPVAEPVALTVPTGYIDM